MLLQATGDLLKRRTRVYRGCVLLVLLVVFSSITAAFLLFSPMPLMGLLLVIPACTAFVSIDSWLVGHWQKQMLNSWVDGDIDVMAFKQGIRALPWLPANTMNGLLELLPDDRTGVSGSAERRAENARIATDFRRRGRRRTLCLSAITMVCTAGGILVLTVAGS